MGIAGIRWDASALQPGDAVRGETRLRVEVGIRFEVRVSGAGRDVCPQDPHRLPRRSFQRVRGLREGGSFDCVEVTTEPPAHRPGQISWSRSQQQCLGGVPASG